MNNTSIAVTYDNGEVFQHFGRTEQFKVYNVENGKVKDTSIISTSGNGHGALAGMLKENNVDTLICGGIGDGAKNALAEVGITLYGGVTGNTDKVIEDLLVNQLEYNTDVACNHHHGDHEHGEGHNCGGNHH